jgi:uncharacterized membrane protein YdjX (TVP38/TMEM64 family)
MRLAPSAARALVAGMSVRLALLILLLLAGIIAPFLIWGGAFDAALSLEGARRWMEAWGQWSWVAGMVLLVADIVLPIPGTIVMSAMGWMHGWLAGGLAAAAGSFLSGSLAYALCRWLGHGAAVWIAGEDALRRGQALFATNGGWIVALSRWTPVLPEAVACLAGLVGMPWRTFAAALACGSLPLGFAFALIGHLGHEHPGGALLMSALLPALLWLAAGRFLARSAARPAPPPVS